MKLHLPIGLRAALLAVLSVASFSHANLWQMEGLSYDNNAGNFYVWNTFYTQAQGNFNKLVTITINNAPWEIDRNVTFSAAANITATEGNAITVKRGYTFNFNQGSINSDGDFIVNGTFNLNGGYIGRNSSNVGSSSSIIVDGGTFYMHSPSETSTWGNAGIGYGEGTTHTIVLRNGGTFTLEGGHIARNKSRAVITVNSGTTFNLQDGTIGTESGSSVKIDIAGTFNMSGGSIGESLVSTKGTAEINVKEGGAFKMSGGRLGYSGSVNLKVEKGGTMVVSGGDFSPDDRGTLSFSGNGLSGANYNDGGNSSLCVTSKLEGYVRHNVIIADDTTFNTVNFGNEITFVGQFTFGGKTLNKVGQGSIIFTDAYDSLHMTSGYFSTAEGDSGVVNVNRGMVKFDFSASDAFRNFTFNLGYGANVTGTLFVAEGGSYVVCRLGGGITNDNNVTDGRGAVTGGGTLIIDYSGDTPAVSAANVVADETEGATSITKRGSGEQQITGAVEAKAIVVSEGVLTLGSTGHGVTAESFSTAIGATLKLGGDAVAEQLSSSGGSIEAAGVLSLGQVTDGAQLADLTMADGGTLAVGGGTLSSGNVTLTGDNTLTVNLTGDAHLNFGAFAHGNITLTLSDTYLLFENGTRYQLFTGDSYTSDWGSNITLATATVGRKSLTFNAEDGSLTITGSEEALTWAGGAFTWQDAANATSEWQTTSGTDRFYSGDSVTFDSAGGAVTLSGAVVAKQMSVESGEWSFTGGTSLDVVEKLAVEAGASATITAPTTVGGNVENKGTLTLTRDTVIKGQLMSSGTLAVTGNVNVTDSISLQGGTAQFSGSVTASAVSIKNTDTVTFNGDYDVYANQYTDISGSTVVFNGSNTKISALDITGRSRVTFSGTGLTLGNFYQDIDGGSEVLLALDLSAQENTTSSSSGYILSKYIRLQDEDSRFVVQGHVNGQDMTCKYRQNYNLVYGKGTLVMLDTGYQVHNGDTPTEYWDGTVAYGDGILSRFMSRASSAAETNTIRVLELASSASSEHPTVIVFNKFNSYAGYLLKHAQELHVKDGASLGFAYQYDSEYDSISGPRSMWTTYAPNLVLHLAGTGAAVGTESTGKGAALFLTDSDGSDTTEHTVTVPWKIILDGAASINTVTAGAELLLTNELTNSGGHLLTKLGKGKLTLGSGFRTAEGSSGRIDVKAGSLVLGYSDENALKNFSLHVTPGSGVISLQGGTYVVKYLGNDVWTTNTTPNSMISGGGTLIIDMPGDQTTANIGFAATNTGEKVTLVKRGGGSQTLRGDATLNGLTMEGGTLILNGATTAATLSAVGGNLTVRTLSADKVSGSLGALGVASGGSLQIGGGTLSGESLSFVGAGTLNVSLAGGTQLNFKQVTLGGTLRLELSDQFAPVGLGVDSPYRLFETWDSSLDGKVNLVTTQLGRLTVGFENGAIVVTSGERGDLTWASESASVWRASADADLFWTNGNNAQDFFYNGDNVTFATTGEHAISVSGVVSAGTMNVNAGAWSFAVESSLTVGGKLTLTAGASATFTGASVALQGGAELQGGTLTLSAAANTLSGNFVAIGGSVKLTSGAVSSTGSIVLGSEDGSSTATMTVSSTGAKSLGDVTVHDGSVISATTATGWQAGGTRVSGAGTLALSGLGYNAVGADAGLLSSFVSTAAVGAETAKLGVLKLSDNSALGFSGSGELLTNALGHIREIHVGSKGSIGFVSGGGSAFNGTAGVLHLSGTGTGAPGDKYEEGINAALYVGNSVSAVMPWDVVLDSNTFVNPIGPSSVLTLTGTLSSGGYTITKNGQGSLTLSGSFATSNRADGSAADTGVIAVYRGVLSLAYADANALAGYAITLANGNSPIGTLSAERGGRYVIDSVNNISGYTGGTITGGGTLVIDYSGATAAKVGADVTRATDGALTLEKKGSGEQQITGNVVAAAITVAEGKLTLGGSGKSTTVDGAVQVDGTLTMGNSLTLGSLSGAGVLTGGSGAFTLSGNAGAFTGSLHTTGSWKLTGMSGAVALQASFTGSGRVEMAYDGASSVTLSGVVKDSVTLEHGSAGKLILTGKNTSTGELLLHDNAAQLGTAAAAAAWSGSVRYAGDSGSAGLTLVHGSLSQAVTDSRIVLSVDAHGVVDVGGTAGSAFADITINEGGRLIGVSGPITVSSAGTGMALTFGTGNLGEAGQSLISCGGITVADAGAFTLAFTNEALVELLKRPGEDVRLQVLSGGTLDPGSISSLKQVVAPGSYAELLQGYQDVSAEGGSLILHAKPAAPQMRVYLVLADGSADPAVISDYAALDNRIATALDADARLEIALGDDADRHNTITVNNLVGLKGASLVVRSVGSDGVKVELCNALQAVADDAALPDGVSPEAARGMHTEFEGSIIGDAGVSFVKSGSGTLTVGSKALLRSVDHGGVQIAGDLEIQRGAVIIRGGGESSIGSLTFNYDEAAQAGELRGFAVSGSSVTAAGITECGAYTADNGIVLQDGGELIFTGQEKLQSTTISADNGGTLTVAKNAELTLADAAALHGADVQVQGGALSLHDGAEMSGGSIAISSGGRMALGAVSRIVGCESVAVQDGELAVDADSGGLRATGLISLDAAGTLSLGEGASAAAAGVQGSGAINGGMHSTLTVNGKGSVFSGAMGGDGGSMIIVDKGASLTMAGVRTDADHLWNASVREGASLTVDVYESELDSSLGNITLSNGSRLIYLLDGAKGGRMNARLALEDGAEADFVIEANGSPIMDGDEIDLGDIFFEGEDEHLKVTLKGMSFAYFEGTLHWDANDKATLKAEAAGDKAPRNIFINGRMHRNALAGAQAYWAALNPHSETWAHIAANPDGDLARFLRSIYDRAEIGEKVNRELAAGIGSAVSTLGAASLEDMRRQLDAVRNRAVSHRYGSSAWISAEAAYHKLESDWLAPGYTLNGWGGSVGLDSAVGRSASVGVSLTAMYNDLKVSSVDGAKGDLDTVHLSAWARKSTRSWSHVFILSAGMVDASLNRSVSYGNERYITHGSTDGYALGAMYEVSFTLLRREDDSLLVQPVANVQMRHAKLHGYSESGSDAGLRVDGISQYITTFGVGVRVVGIAGQRALNRSLTYEAHMLVKTDAGDRHGSAVTHLLPGGAGARVRSAEMDAVGIEFGGGLSAPLRMQGGEVFLNAAAEVRSGYSSLNASVGIRTNF